MPGMRKEEREGRHALLSRAGWAGPAQALSCLQGRATLCMDGPGGVARLLAADFMC